LTIESSGPKIGQGRGEFNTRRVVDAQVLDLLAATIDRFELMTSYQFLVLPDGWRGPLACNVRHRVPNSLRLFAPQVGPLDSEGVHAGGAVLTPGGDGLVFHHWTDFLTDEAVNGQKRTVQHELARG
jgi:hypothetical protein